MYIIYSASNNNLFKEIRNERVVVFWVEMGMSEEKREKFSEKIHFPCPPIRNPFPALARRTLTRRGSFSVESFRAKRQKNECSVENHPLFSGKVLHKHALIRIHLRRGRDSC